MNGVGVYQHSNGNRYEGEMVNDNKTGYHITVCVGLSVHKRPDVVQKSF